MKTEKLSFKQHALNWVGLFFVAMVMLAVLIGFCDPEGLTGFFEGQ